MKYFKITLFSFLNIILISCSSGNGPVHTNPEMDDPKMSNWKIVERDYPANFTQIFFLDSQNGFIAGHNGTMLKTSDGGDTWNSVGDLSNTASIQDIYFVDKNNGYVAVYDSEEGENLFKTVDGGITWSRVHENLKTSPRNIYFVNSNLGFIGGSDGGLDWQGYFNIYKTTDGGNTWVGIQSGQKGNPISEIYFPNSKIGYAVRGGNNGTGNDASAILKTTNGGEYWKEIFSEDYSLNLDPIYFINSNIGFITTVSSISSEYSVSGLSGTIAKTTDGGESWKLVFGKIDGFVEEFFFRSSPYSSFARSIIFS